MIPGQLQVKIELDLLLLIIRELGSELATSLIDTTNQNSKTTVESNTQPQSRGLHPVGALSVPPLVLTRLAQSDPSQKKGLRGFVLRPWPTTSSRPRSRGLHLVGALSVPPLILIRPDQLDQSLRE